MRILVLGHKGLLGRELIKQWGGRYHVETMPDDWDCLSHDKLLHTVMLNLNPDWVVNCIGITKAKATDPIETIEVNSIWPHRLARICKQHGARMIQISTDCVFDDDLYGNSKRLGEPEECVVLRTSFVGRHPTDKTGLVEWYLQQEKAVPGYYRAYFSGLTTTALARVIERVILSRVKEGGWNVGGEKISKHELLSLLHKRYSPSAAVYFDDKVVYDRSFDSSAFQEQFEYRPPSWESMIFDLAMEYPR